MTSSKQLVSFDLMAQKDDVLLAFSAAVEMHERLSFTAKVKFTFWPFFAILESNKTRKVNLPFLHHSFSFGQGENWKVLKLVVSSANANLFSKLCKEKRSENIFLSQI